MLRLWCWNSDPRERTGVDCMKKPEGAIASQLRESGKKPGPAREARDHYWGVCKERGGPTIGASFSVHSQAARHWLHKFQGQAQTATDAATATKSPVSKHTSLPTPSWNPSLLRVP